MTMVIVCTKCIKWIHNRCSEKFSA